MPITKSEKGWQVRVRPHGREGKDIRRTVKTKSEAIRVEQKLLAQYSDPNFQDNSRDTRTLLELVELEHNLHGKNLTYSEGRLNKLTRMIKAMGNPRASRFNAATFATYRDERLSRGIKERTLNNEHAYLRSALNRVIKAGIWKGENPLKSIEQIKVQESELAWLDKAERQRLISECAKSKSRDLLPVVLICLSTGARWNEATAVMKQHVKDGLLQLPETKGKRRRFVSISPELALMIKNHKPKSRSQLFGDPVRAFRTVIEQARIHLPDGQLTHVLRRSFAVFFMQQSGNVRELQDILGHATLAMTEKYLRFAPMRPESAAQLNPVTVDGLNIADLIERQKRAEEI